MWHFGNLRNHMCSLPRHEVQVGRAVVYHTHACALSRLAVCQEHSERELWERALPWKSCSVVLGRYPEATQQG